MNISITTHSNKVLYCTNSILKLLVVPETNTVGFCSTTPQNHVSLQIYIHSMKQKTTMIFIPSMDDRSNNVTVEQISRALLTLKVLNF